MTRRRLPIRPKAPRPANGSPGWPTRSSARPTKSSAPSSATSIRVPASSRTRARPQPASPIGKYVPSAFPGARLPNTWLKEGPGGGVAVQDRCGPWFTVLRVGGDPPDGGPLAAALERRGAPAAILDQPDGRAAEVYGAGLLVLRPDLHVAWRGDAQPADPERVAAIVTGHG